ncbi:MAG: dicarboxylate/amino acid:cation symporter [Vicinamibacterales bacterium]
MTADPTRATGGTAHVAARASGGLRPGPTARIFIGLLLGIAVGYLWPSFAVAIRPLAELFLRLIRMIVAPLLFSSLVVGIAGGGDLRAIGRIGVKTILYFEAATTVALLLGLAAVNVFRPGAGLAVPLSGAVSAEMTAQRGTWDMVVQIVPASVIDAMARGDILQVVVFAALFGVAVAAIGPKGRPIVDLLDATLHAMFTVTGYVMFLAPIGVFAAIGATVGGQGLGVLVTLGRLVAVMYLGLAAFVLLLVLGVSYVVRVPILAFMRAIREPFLIAFSTASSEAALPRALEVMERFGVPRNIAAFVLPTGYSFNLDGTTLYMATASVFVAQLAGIALGPGQQITMMLTLMLASKGVAGVPRGALVVLTGMLTQFGLPLEGAAILLGVDHVMDMGRTAVNVMGNCVAAVAVSRWEGVFDDQQMLKFAGSGRGI